ncbi:MAG: DUF4398 domain-containing protein [Pseudomonadota bacterium]
MRNLKSLSRLVLIIVIGVILNVAACESTPPVQEMSDARQAIAVAKKAGAEEHAPYHLQSAEDYLASAKEANNERAYNRARRDAKQARMKALDALHESEKATGKDSQEN